MAEGVARVVCAAVVVWLLGSCGQGDPSAGAGSPGFVWCDDLLRLSIGDDLSDDPDIAATQLARAAAGLNTSQATIEAEGLSASEQVWTDDEVAALEGEAFFDPHLDYVRSQIVRPYATAHGAIGVVSITRDADGPTVVVAFSGDVDTDVHEAALQDLVGDQIGVRVIRSSAATDSQLATAGTRVSRLLRDSVERRGPIIATGSAVWFGIDRRLEITVIDDSPATLAEVAAGLADGDEHLVCLRVGQPPRGLGWDPQPAP